MGQWNVVLQPMVKVLTSASVQEQEVRFAVPSAPARNILVSCLVAANSATAALTTLKIYGATSLDLASDTVTTPFWLPVATVPSIGAGTVGVFTVSFSNPPPYLRWACGAITGGTGITWEITLICWDV